MEIQCDCGSFRASLTGLPRNTPGRLACYCDDCQAFLRKINRPDLLDPYGGTEVIPAYPRETVLRTGAARLRCHRLSATGLYRWTAGCCNAPIGNTRPGFPWFGVFQSAYRAADPDNLTRLGPVRSRIMGNFATGSPPFKIAHNIGPRDVLVVLPFVLKGWITGKHRHSPLFQEDGRTPIAKPALL